MDGLHFSSFTSQFLRHTKSSWAESPFILEPWQQEWATELLRRENGRRVYREALLGIARKNGKSALCSALALYALVVEGALYEPGAEVYAAAASKEAKKEIEEVRPAEENHGVDPDREHTKEQAEQEERRPQHKEAAEADTPPAKPLHLLDIKV